MVVQDARLSPGGLQCLVNGAGWLNLDNALGNVFFLVLFATGSALGKCRAMDPENIHNRILFPKRVEKQTQVLGRIFLYHRSVAVD